MKLVVGFLLYEESTLKYLEHFLPSLFAALGFLPAEEYRVLAFDNSAPEHNQNRLSVEYINSQPGKAIEYITDGENLGFAQAYNRLIARARELGAEYFFMVNPDMLLDTDCLKHLVAKMDQTPELASVVPKLLRWDFAGGQKTGIIDSCGLGLKSGLRFFDLGQGEEDQGQYDRADILGPSGAAALFRLSALEHAKDKYGYLDERFFMYKEDCELAYRLHQAGFRSALVPAALAYHDRTAAASGSGFLKNLSDRPGKSRQVKAWSHLNQHLIFVKHWKSQNLVNRLLIISRVLLILIFSLLLEQYCLRNYPQILCASFGLTNIK